MSLYKGTQLIAGHKIININQISNCITEIPQDIKLELNNGTLILKAGSKVYVPNGVGVFDELAITSDITVGATSNDKYMIYVNTGRQLWAKKASGFVSGATTPSAIGNGIWYNTTANRIEWYNGSAWSGNGGRSLPIAIVTASNGAISSIDQVFNGFGYIGRTFFVLPGVKFLHANGRNADGTLKNDSRVVGGVLTQTSTASDKKVHQLIVAADGRSCQIASEIRYWKYDADKNYFVYTQNNDRNWVGVGTVFCGLSSLESFAPKTVFHALDYNDSEYIAHQAMPSDRFIELTLGASGATYIAPADGWFVSRQQYNNGYYQVTLFGEKTIVETNTSNTQLTFMIPVRKGQSFGYTYSNLQTTSFGYFGFLCANGSE